MVYLNNHGPGHVDQVIKRTSELLTHFSDGHLNAYEGFLLLSAIQFHDIGNVFGRKDHESKCRQLLDAKCNNIIPDTTERRTIEKLAVVHGGAFDGDRDTISHLLTDKYFFEIPIRKRIIAALLRFGDELADDHTRADKILLELGKIPESSLIHHRYSAALNSIIIKKQNGKLILNLSYEFDSSLAIKPFRINRKDHYLLDEIYNRTLKMERERRYCMRFLRPHLSIDQIKVDIHIENSENSLITERIGYTLEETGYPTVPASGKIRLFGSEIPSGEDESKYLMSKWGLVTT